MFNIIIIDDVEINRRLIISILKKHFKDCTYYEARDGREGLNLIYNKDIDLIILDLMMPEMDGFEVLKEIKQKEYFNLIPIIVNSAMNELDAIKKALLLGADNFFAKPLNSHEIDFILPLKIKNALKIFEQTKKISKFNTQLKKEMELANFFQKALIENNKKFNSIEFIGNYFPANEVGGDFFDCVENDKEVWFIMADVSGHGVAASMISSMIKVMFSNYIKTYDKPSEILTAMNNYMAKNINVMDIFSFSAFIGKINNNKLTYSNAGHPYPITYKNNEKSFQILEKNGYIAGILDDVDYEDTEYELKKDDIIFLYTDGFFDNFIEFNSSIKKNITTFLNENSKIFIEGKSIELISKHILDNLNKHNASNLNDDISLFLIKIL